jgi:hypothetical protein
MNTLPRISAYISLVFRKELPITMITDNANEYHTRHTGKSLTLLKRMNHVPKNETASRAGDREDKTGRSL